jgi:hypothetical protein
LCRGSRNRPFQKLAPRIDKSIVLYRTFLEENTPDEIARRIEDLAGEREALVVVVQDHPRIIDALEMVDRKNVPVVLLVSDVGYGGKALYVGIDNESAGRTAGYFMRNSLGGRSGNVVSLCHNGAYLTHRQRIIGSPVVATALLDRLLHHAIVIQIEGASQLPAPPARRPDPGEPPRQIACTPAAVAPASRPPAQRQEFRSPSRLITVRPNCGILLRP